MPAKSQNGFAHLLLLIPALLISGLIASSTIKTTTKFDSSHAMVLGEDSTENKSGKSESSEAEKKSEEAKKEDQKNEQENKSENRQSSTFSTNNSGTGTTKNKTKIENGKTETEFETPGGQKVKTKIEDDGTTKIEIEQGKIKIKYILENGKVVLKAEDESGEEVELEDEERESLEQGIEDNGIKIATESGQVRFGRSQNALTNFPLSINPLTNELIVTTPAGEKIVTVLPDQAVANLLATNVVNLIEASESAGVSTAGPIKLVIKDNEAVYEINGVKTYKVLGFIPVNSKVKAFVSAENGDVVSKEESILSRLLDILSPGL